MAKLSKSFTNNRTFLFITAGIIMLINLAGWCFGTVFLVRSWMAEPIGEPLALSTLESEEGESDDNPDSENLLTEEMVQDQESDQQEDSEFFPAGEKTEWVFLAVAIDYRGDNYLYGLADSIRLVRVDFETAQINVVSLPRNLLVMVPTERIQAENPILLNQAYFYGSEGMQKYDGSGFGAGALAETIQSNFGVTVDHYVVVDFKGFIGAVDALGGIEVDLPEEIKVKKEVLYPKGKQTLSGEEALILARTRTNYSDLQRMSHQDLVLQAIFRKLIDPTVIYRLPKLVTSLQETVLTDVSPEQIWTLINLLQRMGEDDTIYASPPADLITHDDQYVPSVRQEMQILRWDTAFIDWLHQALWQELE